MKKSIIIAAIIAFGAIFNGNAANPTTHTTVTKTENATITRTATPFTFMHHAYWKITITIKFSRPIEVSIEFEGIMAGGNGNGEGTVEASNVTLNNGLVNFSLPENTKGLAGATNFRIIKGGKFKTADGKIGEIKAGQVLRMQKPYSFQCAYSTVTPRDAASGMATGKRQ